MKDKHTILNELVANAGEVMAAKAEYLDTVADQFKASGRTQEEAYWRRLAERARLGAEIIKEQAGCWA